MAGTWAVFNVDAVAVGVRDFSFPLVSLPLHCFL